MTWLKSPSKECKPIDLKSVQAKLGFDPRTMPMKSMSVEQRVSEGLNALLENRSRVVPGRMNRIMNALVPASIKRTMTAKMLAKALAANYTRGSGGRPRGVAAVSDFIPMGK